MVLPSYGDTDEWGNTVRILVEAVVLRLLEGSGDCMSWVPIRMDAEAA